MQKYLDPAFWQQTANDILNKLIAWFTSPQFYAQIAAIIVCVAAAWFLARLLNRRVSWFSDAPARDVRFYRIRQYIHALSDLLFALLCYVFLGFAVDLVTAAVGAGWLVKIAQGLAVIFLLYTAINRFITHPMLRTAMLYIGIPVATLQVFEYLDDTTAFLDSISMEAGNIRISLYFLIKAAIAGGFFFWLGTISNRTGQNAIRSQEALDLPTKELFATLFLSPRLEQSVRIRVTGKSELFLQAATAVVQLQLVVHAVAVLQLTAVVDVLLHVHQLVVAVA